MPLRVYHRPTRTPPSAIDHLLAHPFEILIAAFGLFIGVALSSAQGLDIAFGDHGWLVVNPELEQISDWLSLAYGVTLTMGSVAVIAGIFNNDDDLMVGWMRERIGLLISSGAWSAIAFTIVTLQTNRVFAWGLSLSVAVGCLIRFVATRIEERRTREVTGVLK